LPTLAASEFSISDPPTLTSLNTCRPTSWRICFGGALR
jgi:hypothetical protein